MARKATKFLVLSVFISLLIGCEKKPMLQPESMDPIIADLETQLKMAEKEQTAAVTELATARADLAKAGFDAIEAKRAKHQLFKWSRTQRETDQKVKYLQLRIESRRIYARQSYLEAFKADKPWPSQAMIKEYETYKRLKSVSLRWDDRVPNLADRIEKMNTPPPEEKKAK